MNICLLTYISYVSLSCNTGGQPRIQQPLPLLPIEVVAVSFSEDQKGNCCRYHRDTIHHLSVREMSLHPCSEERKGV